MAAVSIRFRGSSSGIVGKLLGTVFLAAFLAGGIFFAYKLVELVVPQFRAAGWEEVPCIIEESAVELQSEAGGGSEPYLFRVRYRYVFQGQEHRGDRYRIGYGGSADASEAERLLSRYPAGAGASCRVDPDDPTAAVLEASRPLGKTLLFLLLPLAFILAGAGGIAAMWWPKKAAAEEGDGASGASLTRKAKKAGGTGCVVAFFLLFAGFGSLFLIPFFVVPAIHILEARSWEPVPCTIVRSWVESHSSDDGTTYSVEVLYRYELGGREYQGSRYSFFGGSSSGYEGKAEVVSSLPPGTAATCYVDPEDPHEAVLERGFTGAFAFGLIPLVFVAVGVGGALLVWRLGGKGRRDGKGRPRWLPGSARAERRDESRGPAQGFAFAPSEGPAVLEARHGPIGKFIGITLVAAFWNGIVGVFVWQWYQGFQRGAMDGCLTLFLIPFVLIGLLLLIGVPYQLLALFNPRPRLSLSRGTLPLGTPVELSWAFSGAAGRIRRLKLSLEGREEATYRQGTSTSTAKNTFAQILLRETELAPEITAGSTSLTLPRDTMHSFEAPHNKVVWTLKLAGEIARWPDVDEEFPLTVLPPER